MDDRQIEATQEYIYALAADPDFRTSGVCFAAHTKGVSRSEDGGASWYSAFDSLGLETPFQATSVAVSPCFRSDGLVLAGLPGGIARSIDGGMNWSILALPAPPPFISSLAISPDVAHDGMAFAGTMEDGVFLSYDRGEHWERVSVADHAQPVWSITFHPHDPKVMFIGYENCEIFRSEDGGEHWQQLPVTVRFPEVTVAPGANPAKRILELSANPANPNELYGAIEVGGIIRSLDGGEHWDNVSHGHYLNDDTVDMHGVLVGRWRPGTVFAVARAGLFRSSDQGEHWVSARLEPLNPKGQTYCRDIREVPGDPKTIWVAAGPNFQSDAGVLFRSTDGGLTWGRVEMDVEPKTTMFAIAFDERQPKRMYCATSGGEVFASEDGGQSWAERHLPEGATQVYAMACA